MVYIAQFYHIDIAAVWVHTNYVDVGRSHGCPISGNNVIDIVILIPDIGINIPISVTRDPDIGINFGRVGAGQGPALADAAWWLPPVAWIPELAPSALPLLQAQKPPVETFCRSATSKC